MGYPEDSVRAYVDNKELLNLDFRKLFPEYRFLLNFRISKDNPKTAIDFIKREHDIIKKNTPRLYEIMMDYGKCYLG